MKHQPFTRIATAPALLFLALTALGQPSFTGMLASYYDTWNRMTSNGVSSGQNCFYEVTPFDVTSGEGTNTFILRTTNFAGSINIYATKFFPLTPVVNFWADGAVTNAVGTLVYSTYLNPGSYECVISSMNAGQTGTYGVTISGPASTTIKPRPTFPDILQSPQDQTILTNHSATLQFASEGAYPRHYQWHQGVSGFPTNAISGATNFTYVTPALTTVGDYFYWARVTNAFGTADTATARIRVSTNGGPTLVSGNLRTGNRRWNRPDGQGGAVTNLSYYKMFSYQVFTNGSYIISINTTNFNGTLDLYSQTFFPNLPNAQHAGVRTNGNPLRLTNNVAAAPTTFILVVSSLAQGQTGTYSGTISGPALLNELANPYFVQQPTPSNQVIWPGEDPGPITVGTITPDVTYEWYPGVSPGVPADGLSPISGAVTNVFDPPPTTNSQWFWARIYNSFGYEDSALAQVFVRPIPGFSSYPTNQTIPYGATNTLIALATNIPFVLNWFAGNSPFSTNLLTSVIVQGVTNNYIDTAQISYTLPLLLPGPYNFWVQSTNLAGTTNGSTFTVTVIKRPLTVTLRLPNSPTYDGTPKPAFASATDPNPGGPPLPDPLEIDITYQTGGQPATNAAPVDAGVYAVVATVNDPNFSGSATGTMIITKAPLTVIANDQTRLYGDPNPPFTMTLTGFVNGETVSVLDRRPTASTTATTNSPVGSYPITASGAVDNDYTFLYQTGVLTVTQAPLTLAGTNLSRPFGQTNPPLSGTVTGLKNNDPITVTWMTTATPSSPPGVYPITPSIADPNLRLSNYNVTTNAGSLTVIAYITRVTNTNDTGAGSLRQAALDVVPGNFILFDPNVTGTITLSNGQIGVDKDMTIVGPGANVLTVSGNTSNRIAAITNAAVNVSGLTFANGSSGNGGAIFLQSGTLSIDRCVFTNNVAGTGLAPGGAIYVNSGALNVSNSTFAGNHTLASHGGAIYSPLSGSLTFVNSTFYNNYATNGFIQPGGGAIACATLGTGSLTLLSCTIVSNNAVQGGAIYKPNAATVSIRNCIIANNNAQTGPDLSGSNFVSAGFNLIGKKDGSTGFTNTLGQDQVGSIASPLDPKVAALADNGGPTPTLALLSNSPAIDKGNSSGLHTDQRGGVRPFDKTTPNVFLGDGADIGAFEVGSLLRITGVQPAGQDLLISFTTDAANTYALQRADDLAAGAWTVLATNIQGTGLIVTVTNVGALNLPEGFYRARSLP